MTSMIGSSTDPMRRQGGFGFCRSPLSASVGKSEIASMCGGTHRGFNDNPMLSRTVAKPLRVRGARSLSQPSGTLWAGFERECRRWPPGGLWKPRCSRQIGQLQCRTHRSGRVRLYRR